VQNTTHPGCSAAPLSRGELPGSSVINRLLGESPLERGASSVVKMEEAGCVKIRIPACFAPTLTFRAYRAFGIIRDLFIFVKVGARFPRP